MWSELLGIGRRLVAILLILMPVTASGLLAAIAPASAATGTDTRWTSYWVGRQVVTDMALEPSSGRWFTVDPAVLDRIGEAEPFADIGSHRPVKLLEVTDHTGAPSDASSETTELRSSQAELVIAEVIVALLLADEEFVGSVGGNRGAQARIQGHLLMTAAKAQADLLVLGLTSDSVSEDVDAARSLEALSRLAAAIDPQGAHGAAYGDAEFLPWFVAGAHAAHALLDPPSSLSMPDQADAVAALEQFMRVSSDPDAVGAEIDERADAALVAITATSPTIVDLASALRLLSIATELGYGATGASALTTIAQRVASWIEAPTEPLATHELASLIEGLDAYGRHATQQETSVDPNTDAFIAAAVTASGLVTGMHDPSQVFDPVEMSPYPEDSLTVPGVPVGPTHHPRFLAGVEVMDETWTATGNEADAAATLRLATALIAGRPTPSADATGTQDISGPEDDPQDAPETVEDFAADDVTVEATEFAFGPTTIEVMAGSEITLIFDNAGTVPHNIDIQDLGVVVFAEPGQRFETTLTVPDTPGTLQFICNLPGHQQAGMVGTLSIVASVPVQTDVTEAAPDAIVVPPDTLGPDESQSTNSWIWIAFIGALLVITIVAIWGMWRLVIALDDPLPEPVVPSPQGEKVKEKTRP